MILQALRVPLGPMPLVNTIARFARSPQGKKLASQAMRMANDPKNRQKIERVRQDLARKRRPNAQ